MTEQNLNTHLCGSIYRKEGRCPHLLYCDNEARLFDIEKGGEG